MKKLISFVPLILVYSSCFNYKIVGYQTSWKDLIQVQADILTISQQEAPIFTSKLDDSLKVPLGYEVFERANFKWAILKVKFIELRLTKESYARRTILMQSSKKWGEFFTEVTYVIFPIRPKFEKKIKSWYDKNQIIYVNMGPIIYLNQRPYIIFSNVLLEENRKYSDNLISSWD